MKILKHVALVLYRVLGLSLVVSLGLGLVSPALALEETTVLNRVVGYLAADRDCSAAGKDPGWERRVLDMPHDGYRLRYSRFGCAIGEKGALVIAPGRSEPSYEYAETAIDFVHRGYGPVYVIDHRGQGLSPRLLPDADKSHVENFDDYVDDFDAFVEAVQADLGALGTGPDFPLFLTSNSMGGAIAIGYFQKVGADNPFDAAVLVSAMIHVNYISFTGKANNWFNLRVFSESGVALQGWWRCGVARLWNAQLCNDYAARDTFGPYEPGSRNFATGDEAMMTQSRARHMVRTYMWDTFDWRAIQETEYVGENWNGPQIGGTTNNWARDSVRFLRNMRDQDSLSRMVYVPLMLMSGTRDLRAYRPYAGWMDAPPDLSRHTEFCDELNAQSLKAKGEYICEFVAVNGAFHEIYKERDAERDKALDAVDWFLQGHVTGAP